MKAWPRFFWLGAGSGLCITMAILAASHGMPFMALFLGVGSVCGVLIASFEGCG